MNELKHYNVKGTNWYKHKFGNWERHAKYANGQPNPETNYKQQMDEVTNLNNEMNNEWDYGVIDDGKKINEEYLDDYDFSKYRTIPLNELKKSKIGVCWDFVNYQHDFFKKNGIKDNSYLLFIKSSESDDEPVTHTFSTVDIGDKKYWFESSNWKNRGIHEINSYEDAVNKILGKDYHWYGVYEYNPDGMDKGLSGDEFIDIATKNGTLKESYKYAGTKSKSGNPIANTYNSYLARKGELEGRNDAAFKNFFNDPLTAMKADQYIKENIDTKGGKYYRKSVEGYRKRNGQVYKYPKAYHDAYVDSYNKYLKEFENDPSIRKRYYETGKIYVK